MVLTSRLFGDEQPVPREPHLSIDWRSAIEALVINFNGASSQGRYSLLSAVCSRMLFSHLADSHADSNAE